MKSQILTTKDEDIFRGLLERIADGMLFFASDRIVDCNRASFAGLGYSERDALLGRKLADLSPEQQANGENSRKKEQDLMSSVSNEDNLRAEWIFRRSSGDTFPVELLLTRVPKNYPFRVCVLWRDISRRKQIELELQQSQQTLEKRVEERTKQIEREQQVAGGLRELLNILNSNQTVEEILAYIIRQTAHLLGNNAGAVYLVQGDLLVVKASFGVDANLLLNVTTQKRNNPTRLAVVEKRPIIISDSDSSFNQVSPDTTGQFNRLPEQLKARYRALLAVPLIVKEHIYGAITLYYSDPRVFSEEEIGLAMAFADQAALAFENAFLRVEAEKDAAAAERNRIARDLHDSVTQTLFSATLIAQVLPRLWNRDKEEGEHQLEELRLLTRGALAEMRTLLLELRPSAFAKAQLSESLKYLVDAAIGRTGIPIKLTLQGETLVPPEVKTVFYRIAQEALNNIIKHSEASQAEVVLVRQQEIVLLSVRDNGIGFRHENVPQTHFGLAIMAERAQSLGASITIDTQPLRGTTISVRWENVKN